MRFSPDGKYFYVNGIGFPLSHHLVLTAIFRAGRALQRLRAEPSSISLSRSRETRRQRDAQLTLCLPARA